MDNGIELKPGDPVMYKVGRGFAKGTVVRQITGYAGGCAFYQIRSEAGFLFQRSTHSLRLVVQATVATTQEDADGDEVPAAV